MHSFFGKIINYATWLIFFFFVLITIIVIIAQNSNPGDTTYSVKLGFEQVMVMAYQATGNEGAYQIQLTVKRLDETENVINTDHSHQSLNNLDNQITTTANTILQTSDPQKQQQLASTYINTLMTASRELEKTKQQLVANAVSPVVAAEPKLTASLPESTPVTEITLAAPPEAVRRDSSPTLAPTSVSTPVLPAVAQPPVVAQIDQTRQKIKNTVNKLNIVIDEHHKDNREENGGNDHENK